MSEPIFSVLNGKVQACQVGSGYCDCPSGESAVFYYEYGHYEVDGVLYGNNVTMCCPDGWSSSINSPSPSGFRRGTCQHPTDPNITIDTNNVYCSMENGLCN